MIKPMVVKAKGLHALWVANLGKKNEKTKFFANFFYKFMLK